MAFKTLGYVLDPVNFRIVRDEIGIGRVVELSPLDASLLAPHIGSNYETVFISTSGCSVHEYSGVFQSSEGSVAIEWVRRETKPKSHKGKPEPEINAHRYIFGIGPDGKCHGYEVTELKPDVSKVQIGNHWMTLNQMIDKYFH
jgi:hypothetical protein